MSLHVPGRWFTLSHCWSEMVSEKPLLQHLFKQGNVEYYKHQPRDEKSYRVVIKNLHATISTDDTKHELQNIGFKIRSIHSRIESKATIASIRN